MSTLLDRAAVEVRQPLQRTRRSWHNAAIGFLFDHVQGVVQRVHQLASRGCDGAPVGSLELRNLLAQPLLQLLSSPLLDLLAGLQHAMVDGGDTVLSAAYLRLGRMNPAHLVPIIDLPGKALLVRSLCSE